ncbi:DUF6766 family protein [Myxococcus sp. CA033]|uniref:DUF6766 family protein n=1 Tax=unclassified Myxococcus TaxID=2648731 RepID=UPI00352D6B56
MSVWLREKGSPESKPVNAPHSRTGKSYLAILLYRRYQGIAAHDATPRGASSRLRSSSVLTAGVPSLPTSIVPSVGE